MIGSDESHDDHRTMPECSGHCMGAAICDRPPQKVRMTIKQHPHGQDTVCEKELECLGKYSNTAKVTGSDKGHHDYRIVSQWTGYFWSTAKMIC